MEFTKGQLTRIIDSADEVITALAGTNDDIHPDNSKKMCAAWDHLNDYAAPPEVVREMARQLLASIEQDPIYQLRDVDWYDTDKRTYDTVVNTGGAGRIVYAAPQLPQRELTVFYKSMPESNGKENWTAILHRKGEGIQNGITIDRSEYPGRVLYAADRVRYLIGEKLDRPYILDYDGDKHSGYVWPRTKESAAVETLESKGYIWQGGQFWKPPIGKAPAYITGEHPAVPEEATPDDIEILASIRPPHGVAYQWDEDQRNAAADAWNACRGSILQLLGNSEQLEPLSQPYTLPAEVREVINRLLDNDGSRGVFSAVRSYDAREELERLLAAAPQQEAE